MDAGACGCGVEENAGQRTSMVCDSGALVGREVDGGIGVPGGDDGESLGGDDWAEALSEGESNVFFDGVVRQMGAGVGSAMGGIEKDEIAVEGWKSFRGSGRGSGGLGLSRDGRCGRDLRWRRRLCEASGGAQQERACDLEDKSMDRRHGSWGVRVRL